MLQGNIMRKQLSLIALLLVVSGSVPITWAGVTVTFENPSQYTDFSLNDSKTEAIQNHLTGELEKYFQSLSKSYLPERLKPWRSLSMTLTWQAGTSHGGLLPSCTHVLSAIFIDRALK